MDIFRGVRRIARASAGNIAVTFALCALPICLVGGAAIDIKQHTDRRAAVQSALDMAGLAAARAYQLDPSTPHIELQNIAQTFFTEEVGQFSDITMMPVALTVRADDHLELSVDGHVRPGIMSMLGNASERGLDTECTIDAGLGQVELEIALVLDTTDSMNLYGKLDAVKATATRFASGLIDPTSNNNRMAVVPFSQNSNVGTHFAGSPWLDVEPDNLMQTECLARNQTWIDANCPNGVSVLATLPAGYCSQTAWDDNVELCIYLQDRTWHGCVAPRRYPDNIRDDNYALRKIPGIVTVSPNDCSSEILPLTDDLDAVNLQIASLNAAHQTYMPSGLAWGWRVLTQQAPYDEGENNLVFASRNGKKVLILMSDGTNSIGFDASGRIHPAGSHFLTEQPDDEMLEVCADIRDDNIIVFSIAFDLVGDLDAIDLIKNCASAPNYFFNAADAGELDAAFDEIKRLILMSIAVTS